MRFFPFLAASLLGGAFSSVFSTALAEPGPARQQELVRFVHQECGFCHGLRLTGGLGPPLSPERMRAIPDEASMATILYGRPGTAMPGWQPFLNEDEVRWIVNALKEGFPQ